MTLDDTLVSAAHDLHNTEHLYGNSADLWQKASKLATIKGKTLTEYDLVLAHICLVEAQVSNRTSSASLYPKLASLYALLGLFAPIEPDPADQALEAIEADIRVMASKLAPEMPKAEPIDFGSPNGA